MIEFDVPAAEERIKKLEEEIRILNLKLDISSNNGGNDVIEAQRTLEDAKRRMSGLLRSMPGQRCG
ncbi:hypothetical protein [Enterocloster sp.]|uniref:hypothetical protein n=1 Tax=Enterocloster sp. TaxID=2719315 RepID=UPI0039A38E52